LEKKIFGRGTAPSPDFIPNGEEDTPSIQPTPVAAAGLVATRSANCGCGSLEHVKAESLYRYLLPITKVNYSILITLEKIENNKGETSSCNDDMNRQ